MYVCFKVVIFFFFCSLVVGVFFFFNRIADQHLIFIHGHVEPIEIVYHVELVEKICTLLNALSPPRSGVLHVPSAPQSRAKYVKK